jgi:hypothetical protein
MLAVFFAGIAVASLMPAFEGYDETAHWSTIQQRADTGHGPEYDRDRVSGDVDRYAGPLPYSVPDPNVQNIDYKKFRLMGAPDLTTHPTVFHNGSYLNWEAQHPPLYYVLMTPLYDAARGLAFKNNLLVLRLGSWVLAFAGILIAAEGSRRFIADGGRVALFMAAWPFLVPEFLPEMARVGNDSLCLCLFGVGWALLMRLLQPQGGWRWSIGLGIALGLGLLTKALFLPIVFALALLLLMRWARERTAARAVEFALAVGVALAIGLWWYLDRHAHTGSFTGSDEFIRLGQSAGGWSDIRRHLSPLEFLRGLANIGIDFLWGGTWSLAQPNPILLAGPALLLAVPLLNWLRDWRKMTWIDLAALLCPVALAASLVYHVLVIIGLTGNGAGTPGHYLHVVAPALAFALARGWRWKMRWISFGLIAWTTAFTVYIWTMQLSLYSGCASKAVAHSRYLLDQGCFIDAHSLFAVSHVGLAGSALVLTILLIVAAARFRSGSAAEESDLIPL